jgi:hypothetical protein
VVHEVASLNQSFIIPLFLKAAHSKDSDSKLFYILAIMRGTLTVIFFLILTEANGIIHWLEKHLLACPFKSLTGLDCPGCGFQRSFIALLKGDLAQSFKFYPATLPFIALIVYMLLHLKFDFKNGAFILKLMYILVSSIIIINYIYKVYHLQII